MNIVNSFNNNNFNYIDEKYNTILLKKIKKKKLYSFIQISKYLI
jgi:hypothetical protein